MIELRRQNHNFEKFAMQDALCLIDSRRNYDCRRPRRADARRSIVDKPAVELPFVLRWLIF